MLDASVGRTIARVAESFRKLGIPFHVTGGIVSSFYGVPRYTMDIDFVVLLEGGHRNLPAVVAEIGEAFDIDLESARASLRSHGIFQAMDGTRYTRSISTRGKGSRTNFREVWWKNCFPVSAWLSHPPKTACYRNCYGRRWEATRRGKTR